MYIFEVRHNNNVNNFFDAVYWSYVTIASLGYGDISPTSSEGRVVTLFLILAGIAFMSFATSIITSAFSEKLMELKEDKSAVLETEHLIIKLLVYRCKYKTNALKKFFRTQMKLRGWQEVGVLSSKITLLVFKSDQNVVFITISEGTFSTEVRIYGMIKK